VVPFAASNAGVLVAWSAPLLERFEGVPIKNAALTAGGRTVRGEPTITATGLEGGPIYALGPELRSGHGLEIDLQPDLDADALAARLVDRRRPKDSVSTWLRKGGLSPVDVALLRDATANRLPTEATAIANLAKAVPIPVDGLAPIDRAISTAGGIALDAIDDTGMLLDRPGTWVAGEMVAWDAPTGGYLIQACLSTGHRAGVAAARWAAEHP
jgi:predicted flavoprotein YhiN